MRITKDQLIESLPAPVARDLVRAYSNRPRELRWAGEVLGVDEDAARTALDAFTCAGYLDPILSSGAEPRWITTGKGNELAQAVVEQPTRRRWTRINIGN